MEVSFKKLVFRACDVVNRSPIQLIPESLLKKIDSLLWTKISSSELYVSTIDYYLRRPISFGEIAKKGMSAHVFSYAVSNYLLEVGYKKVSSRLSIVYKFEAHLERYNKSLESLDKKKRLLVAKKQHIFCEQLAGFSSKSIEEALDFQAKKVHAELKEREISLSEGLDVSQVKELLRESDPLIINRPKQEAKEKQLRLILEIKKDIISRLSATFSSQLQKDIDERHEEVKKGVLELKKVVQGIIRPTDTLKKKIEKFNTTALEKKSESCNRKEFTTACSALLKELKAEEFKPKQYLIRFALASALPIFLFLLSKLKNKYPKNKTLSYVSSMWNYRFYHFYIFFDISRAIFGSKFDKKILELCRLPLFTNKS